MIIKILLSKKAIFPLPLGIRRTQAEKQLQQSEGHPSTHFRQPDDVTMLYCI